MAYGSGYLENTRPFDTANFYQFIEMLGGGAPGFGTDSFYHQGDPALAALKMQGPTVNPPGWDAWTAKMAPSSNPELYARELGIRSGILDAAGNVIAGVGKAGQFVGDAVTGTFQRATGADATSVASGKTGAYAGTGTPVGAQGLPSGTQWADLVNQVATEYDVDPRIIYALIDIESGGDPNAVSVQGAQGLIQVMPFHFKEGENPLDPLTNLRVGIGRVYKPALDRWQDPEKAAAAYFGALDRNGNITGASDATGATGHVYVNKFNERMAAQGPGSASAGVQSGGLYPSQRSYYTGEANAGVLDMDTALSICGPIAAVAFARANGRNPTLQEAIELAKGFGWNAQQGMSRGPWGSQGTEGLLEAAGGRDVTVDNTPDWDFIAGEASAKRPMFVSTPKHYFIITDYDPDTGRYYVGDSGRALTNGTDWMTAAEIQRRGEGINAVLYA